MPILDHIKIFTDKLEQEIKKDVVQKDELIRFFQIFIDLLKRMKSDLDSTVSSAKQETASSITEYRNKLDSNIKAINKLSFELETSNAAKLKQLSTDFKNEIAKVKDLIPLLPDLSVYDAKIEDMRKSMPDIKSILDTPEQIRDKVKSLPEGQRWDMEDVNDLKREIDSLRNELRSIPRGGSRSMMGRTGGVAVEKLNAQLNGVTKTFQIPNLRDVVAIVGSSFPGAFASEDDFTVGNKSVTFTDSIDAATTLSAGQTILVIYNQLHFT